VFCLGTGTHSAVAVTRYDVKVLVSGQSVVCDIFHYDGGQYVVQLETLVFIHLAAASTATYHWPRCLAAYD
jgi:hypothetical protein